MHAEILPIGDEIVSGQIVDTNSPWLSARLEELGVHVLYHTSVGDEIDPLADTFRLAIARSDIVISTGGLGPTADDLTRPALAKAVGRKLVVDPQALEYLRQMFARRKRPMPKSNEVQAQFPEGSRIVRNPNGTAPGIELDAPRPNGKTCRVVCLPGVPAEMKEMWHDSVAERLRQFGAGKRLIRRKLIKCFGAGESQMEAMLPEGFLAEPQAGHRHHGQPDVDHLPARGRRDDRGRVLRRHAAGDRHDPRAPGQPRLRRR